MCICMCVCVCVYGHDTSRFMENVTRVVAFQFWLHSCCINRDLMISINLLCIIMSIERSMETEELKKMMKGIE